jgi:hypothetical protein
MEQHLPDLKGPGLSSPSIGAVCVTADETPKTTTAPINQSATLPPVIELPPAAVKELDNCTPTVEAAPQFQLSDPFLVGQLR